MFRKVLIANRGEIARRIARTCRRMGLQVATVHSEADRDALHVRDIGESVLIGAAPARDSYLDIARVVQAARQVGADAVHPGYGFLSENAEFAEALQQAVIAFIGPSPQVLRDFGDNAAAKRLAMQAGVPTIPGSPGASADPRRVAMMVEALGFPALLKAAAGGGGKGIRILLSAEHMAEEIAAAMREGASAFGDPSLLVERYLPHGRHVEVQILGDGRGNVLHLWERECSLQRRHQKVVEEAPALALPAGLRQAMLDAAVALGRQVNYRALGTVEFLVAGDAFHFLEVNPRLQVEHPVTECVTGLDLVELQIRAAAGEPLALAQADVRCDGHAIEVRVYAEDPAHDFLPSTGTLHRLQLPRDGVRVETGVDAGTVITPHYDPMIAKLIVHDSTRPGAIAKMREALAATRLAGVASNLGFVEALLRSPAVTEQIADTGTIDQLPKGAYAAAPSWLAAAPHVAAAWVLRGARMDDLAQPASGWSALTHWRLGAAQGYQPLQPQYEVQDHAKTMTATVGTLPGPRYRVSIDDHEHEIGFAQDAALDAQRVAIDGLTGPLRIGRAGDHVWLGDGRHTETLRVRPALQAERANDPGAGAALVAPLTGKVIEVRVQDGDRVTAGQVLLVIESMKMEMRLTAPHAGIARGLSHAVGASVERGALLAKVEALEVTE
jgi:3-methylcrotonyl-CoA carboxylase alpha subunit